MARSIVADTDVPRTAYSSSSVQIWSRTVGGATAIVDLVLIRTPTHRKMKKASSEATVVHRLHNCSYGFIGSWRKASDSWYLLVVRRKGLEAQYVVGKVVEARENDVFALPNQRIHL